MSPALYSFPVLLYTDSWIKSHTFFAEGIALDMTLMLSLPAAGRKSLSILVSWPFLFWHWTHQNLSVLCPVTQAVPKKTSKEHSQGMAIPIGSRIFNFDYGFTLSLIQYEP